MKDRPEATRLGPVTISWGLGIIQFDYWPSFDKTCAGSQGAVMRPEQTSQTFVGAREPASKPKHRLALGVAQS